jgi:uncharacterized protein YjbI with pentapeptide repeats
MPVFHFSRRPSTLSISPPLQTAGQAKPQAGQWVQTPQLVQLARDGDPLAIAELLTQHFRDRGLQVWAYCAAEHLHLWIAGPQLPERAQLIPWLQERFRQLAPEPIDWVTVQGAYQIAKNPDITFKKAIRNSNWSVTFALHADLLPPAPVLTPSEQCPFSANPVVDALLRAYARGKRQFAAVDLSHADLQGLKLSMSDFRQANLTGANLSHANLSHADLGLANLQNTQLVGADVIKTNLQGANLAGADLRGANLAWSNLCGANLRGAKLEGAILTEVDITLATLPDGTVLE